jgi:hypothetical protein
MSDIKKLRKIIKEERLNEARLEEQAVYADKVMDAKVREGIQQYVDGLAAPNPEIDELIRRGAVG